MKIKKMALLIFLIFIVFIPKTTNALETPVYRALLIGNSNYQTGDSLAGPKNDLAKMENALNHNYFGKENQSFSKITIKHNLTNYEMIESIKEEFKYAKTGDISYFYYSGHGYFDPYSSTSSLVGVDDSDLSVHALEKELSNIPGTFVIILDTCHSGGFINKGHNLQSPYTYDENEEDSLLEVDLNKYNNSIISVFSNKNSRNYLTNSKYKVITSSSKSESSYEYGYTDGWGWGGGFTRAFVIGNGYNNIFMADSNNDKNITLNEIYNYTKKNVQDSNVQVYPINDSYIIGSQYQTFSPEKEIFWKVFDDIPIDKVWKVRFNMNLDEKSWKDKLYILDSNKNIFPTKLLKETNEKTISIYPQREYNNDETYTIVIEDNIFSKNGSKLNSKVLAKFSTENTRTIDQELPLNIVQHGHFYDYPHPSVKQAFESFFANCLWEYFYSTDDNHVVEFNGTAFRNGNLGVFTIQFTINIANESFEATYFSFNDSVLSQYQFYGLLDDIYDNYLNPRGNPNWKDMLIDDKTDNLLDNYRISKP